MRHWSSMLPTVVEKGVTCAIPNKLDGMEDNYL
jgi:hypothetical protein